MKKLMALALLGTFMLSSMVFAHPNKKQQKQKTFKKHQMMKKAYKHGH